MNIFKQFKWQSFIYPSKLKIFIFLIIPGIYATPGYNIIINDYVNIYSFKPMFILLLRLIEGLYTSKYAMLYAYEIDPSGLPLFPPPSVNSLIIQLFLNVMLVYLLACFMSHFIQKLQK